MDSRSAIVGSRTLKLEQANTQQSHRAGTPIPEQSLTQHIKAQINPRMLQDTRIVLEHAGRNVELMP